MSFWSTKLSLHSLSSSLLTARKISTTTVVREVFHLMLLSTSLLSLVASAPRPLIHIPPRMMLAQSKLTLMPSTLLVALSISPKVMRSNSLKLSTIMAQFPLLLKLLVTSETTRLESTPQLSAKTPPRMLTMPFLPLDTELRMELHTGLSRTLGALTGETRVTSRLREESTCAVSLFATHIQRKLSEWPHLWSNNSSKTEV